MWRDIRAPRLTQRGDSPPLSTLLRGALEWRRNDPTLFLLLAIRFVGQTGQALFFAWLFVESGSGTEGATQVGSIVIAMMAASILFGLLGGAFADALGLRWALPTGSALRLVAMVVGFLLLSDALWVLAFIYSLASQVFTPAELGLVRIVGRRGLLGSHAALLVLQYVGFALGALVLFPLLSAADGSVTAPVAATALLAATTVIAFVLGARLADGASARRARATANPFAEVLSFFRDDRRALYAAGVLSFADMATRSLLLSLPLYLLADLELTAPGIAAMIAVAALGGLAGLAWIRREWATRSQDQLVRALRTTMIMVIASTLALAVLAEALRLTFSYSQLPSLADVRGMPALSVVVALPVFAVLGAALTATPIASRGLLSARAPRFVQARAFAAQGTLSNLLVLLPLTIATVGAELIGARGILLFVALTGAVVLFVLERALRGEPDG